MGQDSKADDRRTSLRVDKVQLVQLNRFDEEGFRADLATGRTLNISRGGIRLELHRSVPLRSVISLDLVLGDKILDLEGMVVYLEVLDGDRCCMGIEFTNLDDASRAMLAEYVD